MSTVI